MLLYNIGHITSRIIEKDMVPEKSPAVQRRIPGDQTGVHSSLVFSANCWK